MKSSSAKADHSGKDETLAPLRAGSFENVGAGSENRTRDIQLGKLQGSHIDQRSSAQPRQFRPIMNQWVMSVFPTEIRPQNAERPALRRERASKILSRANQPKVDMISGL